MNRNAGRRFEDGPSWAVEAIPAPHGQLAGCKVLIVGINYKPERTGIAPYTTQAAEHFVRQGAEAFVLTGLPHYPHWSVPAIYKYRLRVDEIRNGVDVRRLRHFVPRSQSAGKRALYEGTFGLNALCQRLPFRADVVLAVVPSLAGAAVASLVAHRSNARSVVWVQDLMGSAARQTGIPGGKGLAATTGRLEAAVLRRAHSIVVLNPAFRRYVEDLGVASDRVVEVPNWSHVPAPTSNRTEMRRQLGWGDDHFIALHAGNMGLKQSLQNVIEAARLASVHHPNVRFVLMGDGSQRAQLQALARDVETLEFRPPVPDELFTDVLAAADVLVVNESPSVVDMSLPSKLSSYFSVGMPIIAATDINGGTAEQLLAATCGEVVAPGNPQALLNAVVDSSRNGQLSEIGARGRLFAQRNLDRDVQLSRLSDVIARAAG